jgi:hypothetical protein
VNPCMNGKRYFFFEVRKVDIFDNVKFIWGIERRKWSFGVAQSGGKGKRIDCKHKGLRYLLWDYWSWKGLNGSLIFLDAEVLLPSFWHDNLFSCFLFVFVLYVLDCFCLLLYSLLHNYYKDYRNHLTESSIWRNICIINTRFIIFVIKRSNLILHTLFYFLFSEMHKGYPLANRV